MEVTRLFRGELKGGGGCTLKLTFLEDIPYYEYLLLHAHPMPIDVDLESHKLIVKQLL